MPPELPIAATLDVTRDLCPLTFVKTRLELEELKPGQLLEVFVREGEALENVARSCALDGNPVHAREPRGDGTWRLVIEATAP